MATEDLEWERSKISNQDMNLLKRLGFTKKKGAFALPPRGKLPSPPMEYRLHQLTPNSILHVSIFITLCECFLGVQPNWALWKRIFCLRRNGSHNVAYNIGGVVICVRSASITSTPNSLIPSKGGAKVSSRRTSGKELSEYPVQPTFAVRVQPASSKNLTGYLVMKRREGSPPVFPRKGLGEADPKNLLARRIPFHILAKLSHFVAQILFLRVILFYLLFLPFLKVGKSKNGLLSPDNQGASRPKVESGFPKSAASQKENETEVTVDSSSLPAASPKGKRKRDETIDSGASKADTSRAEKTAPNAEEKALVFTILLLSARNDDEEENAPIDEAARTSTSRTLVVSEARLMATKLHLLNKTMNIQHQL
ncbi:hypothetical protein QYE76_071696 [Lolium multiflorum]|uniref:Transposase (putative) gypsy type domain-containing protein n=1 Tax=Lolium multiflorum TaxID=4521 RepID=A0AAD8SM28_LOLMU|nr:hypothetical protein QYE76_071696 [Lolium multiflorum]